MLLIIWFLDLSHHTHNFFFYLFQCNQLGNHLKDVVDKYKRYEDSSASLLKWLNGSEEEARKQQSEAIAADPQTLQKQLEETKARNTASQAWFKPSLVSIPTSELLFSFFSLVSWPLNS